MWHPHWHTIVLEGGFDRHDTFFFIPLGATAALTEIWRRSVVALFLEKGLLNPDFARKILAWQHSGFSIESGTRILDQPTREALCQYIVRAPLSLQRIRWDEQQDTVTWSASPSGFFKGRIRRYSSLDFIAQVTLHVPPRGRHLVRRYGCTPRVGAEPGRTVRSPFARAGQLVRQEGGRRPRAFRCPEGSRGRRALTPQRPGRGCWPRSTSWTSWPAPAADPACRSSPSSRILPRSARSSPASIATAGDRLPLGGALRRRGDDRTRPLLPLTSSSATHTAAACPPRHAPSSCGFRRGSPGA